MLDPPLPGSLLLLIFLSLLTYNSSAVRLTYPISCPCSLVVKAKYNAPPFLVNAFSHHLRHDAYHTAHPVPLDLKHGAHTRYFRALIPHYGTFNLSLAPIHADHTISSSSHQFISTTADDLTARTCPVLLPQDPPVRFETRRLTSVANGRLKVQTRIVGGVEAGTGISKYTALISLDRDIWRSSCSGTLVGRSTVITAAHCGVSLNATVYFGFVDKTNPGVKRLVSAVRMHSLYNSTSNNGLSSYDLSFVTLSKPAPASAKIMKVNFNPSIPLSNSIVRVAGYGRLEHEGPLPQALHQIDLKVVPPEDCYRIFQEHKGYIRTSQVFCAVALSGFDCSPCQADSGGPIWQYDENDNPVLVGVISRGDGCSTKKVPTLSVRASQAYLSSPAEVQWANSTATLTVVEDSGNMTVTPGPSPSYKPLPSPRPASEASSTGAEGSQSGSSASTMTIVFGSFAGVLLFGAIVVSMMVYLRR